MKSYNEILTVLEARKDRSAWDKGVTAYAVDLLDEYQARVKFDGREATDRKELEEWLLNGASTWSEYSWGGQALIYNGDIAKRLCSPSELKRARNGERRPNSQEEWLDTQARALAQAANRLCGAAF
nr:MAG TPA: hypothetical protein [Caudoviricetes sp.]